MQESDSGVSQVLVIRPGPIQLIYCGIFPAFFVLVGGLAMTDGIRHGVLFSIQEGAVFGGIGLVAFVYVLGLSVEVTDREISKSFLFGLYRRKGAIDRLSVGRHVESNVGSDSFSRWTVTDFLYNGKRLFSLTPGYVWRSRDVDTLVALVKTHRHPAPKADT